MSTMHLFINNKTSIGFSHLVAHSHCGDKAHKCTQCEYSAGTKPAPRHYLLTHSSESLHECKQCTKSFSRAERVEKHIIHNDERQHKKRNSSKRRRKTSTWIHLFFSRCVHACALCSNLFSQASSLRIHIVAYRGEKPFTCPQCDHSSRTKSALRVHLLTQSAGWPTSVHDAANHSANLKI